ncbi:heparan-alpha-glucosaminide N-acetyltransferase [Thermobrachium celere]|uniref:Heparan-alpha-glucosaminide N-acetyltransferase catalytic domain-containing protein n=1 Tax=Thermobrachium celere DSM 8682 TaxID=941824 RepID=R7RT20_9CLOT|nr:heparan-alpha-glucosaminide N-acetyltransferase [Thermobrachium celere]GFR34656.1 hypothetical protein TCEA9_04680 [Thermobrachium celere]CDF59357.1 protein of unknown function DUF1624 [Thermobrachium celere DSM 8682]
MNRIGEIDLFRTIAIILMIIFHFVYDLNEFVGVDINYETGIWYFLGKAAGLLFIIISGISSNFSKKPIKNAFKIFIYAFLINIISYILFKDSYIRFGVLHFLGTMTIFSVILNKVKTYLLILIQVLAYIIYRVVLHVFVSTYLLIPFGFTYSGFVSIDYYPIIPYIIYYILGILIYRLVYKKGKRILPIEIKSRIIEGISKKSLEIYLLHQPVILLVLYFMKLI